MAKVHITWDETNNNNFLKIGSYSCIQNVAILSCYERNMDRFVPFSYRKSRKMYTLKSHDKVYSWDFINLTWIIGDHFIATNIGTLSWCERSDEQKMFSLFGWWWYNDTPTTLNNLIAWFGSSVWSNFSIWRMQPKGNKIRDNKNRELIESSFIKY